jgi:hypothetical protein
VNAGGDGHAVAKAADNIVQRTTSSEGVDDMECLTVCA